MGWIALIWVVVGTESGNCLAILYATIWVDTRGRPTERRLLIGIRSSLPFHPLAKRARTVWVVPPILAAISRVVIIWPPTSWRFTWNPVLRAGQTVNAPDGFTASPRTRWRR